MATTISMTEKQWATLKDKIVEDYGRTTVLISWRLRDTLGFTIREYRDYSPGQAQKEYPFESWTTIRLDFWDEQLHTMFLLKYSDYLL
jgi:hypothetical protein